MKLFATGKGGPAASSPAPANFQPIDRAGLLGFLDQLVNSGQSGAIELKEARGTWAYAFQAGALTHASGGRVRGARQAFDLLWEFQYGEYRYTPGAAHGLSGNLYIDKGRLLDLLHRSQAVLRGPAAPYIPRDQQRPIVAYPTPSPGYTPPPGAPAWGQQPQPPMPAPGTAWAPPGYPGVPPGYPAAPPGYPGAPPGYPQPGAPMPGYPPQGAPQAAPGYPPAGAPQAPPGYPQPFPAQAYPPAPPGYPQAPGQPPYPGVYPGAPQQPAPQAPYPQAAPPSFSVAPMPVPRKQPAYQPPVAPMPGPPAGAPPPAVPTADLQILRASLVAQAPTPSPPPPPNWNVRSAEGAVAPPPGPRSHAVGSNGKKKGSAMRGAIDLQLIKFLLWACERRYSEDDHWTLKNAYEVSTMELRDTFIGVFSQSFKQAPRADIMDDDVDELAAGRMRGRAKPRKH